MATNEAPSESEQSERDSEDDLSDREPGALARERLIALRRQARRSPLQWLFDVRSGERPARDAVRVQVEVGRQLQKLGPGWFTLHSIPIAGDRAIDHLVIGPPGVFLLSSKNHLRDRVRVDEDGVKVNNRPTPYVQEVRTDAQEAGRLLSLAVGDDVTVRPVVVIMSRYFSVRSQPEDVRVVGRSAVSGWLMAEPDSQLFERSKEVFGHAHRGSTWR